MAEIIGLTALSTTDTTNDEVVVRDASATADKRVTLKDLLAGGSIDGTLDVTGAVTFQSEGDFGGNATSISTNELAISSTDAALKIGNPSGAGTGQQWIVQVVDANGRLRFFDQTGSTERFRMTTSGAFDVLSGGISTTGAATLDTGANGSSFGGNLEVKGDLNINPTNTYTITNDTTDRALDANSTTTAELADVLATLLKDLGMDA